MSAFRGWKAHSELEERTSRVPELVRELAATETEVVASMGRAG